MAGGTSGFDATALVMPRGCVQLPVWVLFESVWSVWTLGVAPVFVCKCLDVAVARCLGLFVLLRMCLVVLLRPVPCLCPVAPESLLFCLAHGVQGGRVVAGVLWCFSWWPTWVFVFDTPGKYVQCVASRLVEHQVSSPPGW